MSVLEKALRQLNADAVQSSSQEGGMLDARFHLVIAFVFIITVVSIPTSDPASLVWMFCYPIIMSEANGIAFGRVFAKSLWILPLLIVIGMFNPMLDHQTVWHTAHFTITRGWFTFAALLLRGLLTFQCLIILISSCGFYEICRALQYFKCPKVLVAQLMMLYRYSSVLISEALSMQRAWASRGFGRKSYPLKLWGIFAGQLLLRSLNRAKRVNGAMLSRGFNGTYAFKPFAAYAQASNWLALVLWIGVFACLRFIDITALVSKLMPHL